MEGETQPPPLSTCVSKVLDDDNLLAEIIVRVGFPTCLVRAAAVARRWLRLASGRAFLRRFRELHPPRLLGFYLTQSEYPDPAARFFPMLPQSPPPELAAVVRRANFSLDFYEGARTHMVGCWNGRVITCLHVSHEFDDNDARDEIIFVVHSPLCPEKGMAALPALRLPVLDSELWRNWRYAELFCREEGNALSYIYLSVDLPTHGTKSTVHVYMLHDGDDAWRTHLSLAVDIPTDARFRPTSMLVDNKIYTASNWDEIAVLDLKTSSFSKIQLPQVVAFHARGTAMLSQADDASSVYLIHAMELQIHIWLHKGGNWSLVDNICLREMCAPFLEDDPTALLQINHIGDYTAEFLFLKMGRFTLYLDVECRTLRKVYETAEDDPSFGNIVPFMMIWPPTFPVLKDGPALQAMPLEEQGQEETFGWSGTRVP